MRPTESREDASMITIFKSVYVKLKEKGIHQLFTSSTMSAPLQSNILLGPGILTYKLLNMTITQPTLLNQQSHQPGAMLYPPLPPCTLIFLSNCGSRWSCNWKNSLCSVHCYKTAHLPPTKSSTVRLTETRHQWPGRHQESHTHNLWQPQYMAPHCSKKYAVGMAPQYYRLFEHVIPTTRGYWLTGTYRLFLLYWNVQTVSEHSALIKTGVKLLEFYQKLAPPTAKRK